MSSRVEIYINLEGLSGWFAENISAAIASKVAKFAKETVRVDTRALQGTIKHRPVQSISMGGSQFMVVAETEYAAAQEWGLEDFGKPNYGFTPYMGVSAERVMDIPVLTPIVRDAFMGAIEKSRRRGTSGRN